MTLLGIALAVFGTAFGLTSEHPLNSQWIIGFLMAMMGLLIVILHSMPNKEKK